MLSDLLSSQEDEETSLFAVMMHAIAAHGQEITATDLERAAGSAGRTLQQTTPLYGRPAKPAGMDVR